MEADKKKISEQAIKQKAEEAERRKSTKAASANKSNKRENPPKEHVDDCKFAYALLNAIRCNSVILSLPPLRPTTFW